MNNETVKFVRNVAKGKNLKAQKNLDKILKVKCAKKIADTLKEKDKIEELNNYIFIKLFFKNSIISK